jgi:hypothetical protein
MCVPRCVCDIYLSMYEVCVYIYMYVDVDR